MDERGGKMASQQQEVIDFCYGDGTPPVPVSRSERQFPFTDISVNTYRTIYTYPSAAPRTASVLLTYRPLGARNLLASTDQVLFYLETTIYPEAVNTTPAFALPDNVLQLPLNRPAVLPLATRDAEGDSVVYSLTRPRLSECGFASTSLPGYTYPNAVEQKGTLRIDPRRGVLSWNSPTSVGYYLLEVKAEEWRKGRKISETYLDLTVATRDLPGQPAAVLPPYEPVQEAPDNKFELTGEDLIVTVYPVPVQGTLNVLLRSAKPVKTQLHLLNGQGELLGEFYPSNSVQERWEINTRPLPAGVYLLRLQTPEKTYVQKFTKP